MHLSGFAGDRHEPLGQCSPAQVLDAVVPYGTRALPPLALWELQIICQGPCQVLLEPIYADMEVEWQPPSHDLSRLSQTRVIRHERDDAARRELRGHQPEGLWED